MAQPPASLMRRAWAGVVGYAGRISERETSVRRRGFTVARPQAVARLEAIGGRFVAGYNLAVGASDFQALAARLAQHAPDDAGFVYEGAAMGLAVADFLTPGRRWFDAYIAAPAAAHEYMAWVGYGWALARLPLSPERALMRYRNLHCWLALDGYGFHEGYFHWRRRIDGQRPARALSPQARQVFDQGLGRSLWFVRGADAAPVAQTIDRFPPHRRADLWAGAGLAAAYAGAADAAGLAALLVRSGSHAAALAQGVVFAAQARRRAGNPVPHLDQACRLVLGLDTAAAAGLAVRLLPSGHTLADYQHWRLAIQRACAARMGHRASVAQGEC
jgi:hypothetical protein